MRPKLLCGSPLKNAKSGVTQLAIFCEEVPSGDLVWKLKSVSHRKTLQNIRESVSNKKHSATSKLVIKGYENCVLIFTEGSDSSFFFLSIFHN